MKKVALLFGISLILGSCRNSDNPTKDLSTVDIDSKINSKPTLSDDKLNSIIESIPSPLELASLIQVSGAPFSEKYLNKTANCNIYNSQFKKALNLGVYGADLGYINLYEKTYSTLEYLKVVYQLSNDLNVGQYFDFNTLERLAANNKNLDSIIYISTINFEQMHSELKKLNNTHISALIIIGGWLEGVYLTSEIAKSATNLKSNELMLTIYDERIVLDDLVKLADAYNDLPGFSDLSSDLGSLKKKFDSIEIDNNSSDIIVKENFPSLAFEIKSLRNRLTE